MIINILLSEWYTMRLDKDFLIIITKRISIK